VNKFQIKFPHRWHFDVALLFAIVLFYGDSTFTWFTRR